jgi:hypothetical protein
VNARGTSKLDVAAESVGLWATLKDPPAAAAAEAATAAFSGSVGVDGISESWSLTVSFGFLDLRAQKQDKATMKATIRMMAPTTIPAIAPAGRIVGPDVLAEEEEEDNEESESVSLPLETGVEKVLPEVSVAETLEKDEDDEDDEEDESVGVGGGSRLVSYG